MGLPISSQTTLTQGDESCYALLSRLAVCTKTSTKGAPAHFLEHCAFRATEGYPDGELVRYLQSLGSAFGPDVNAATSLTHTIYKLTISASTLK